MTKQVYDDGTHVLEWYEDDDAHLFSLTNMDGFVIKEYRTDDIDAANRIWEIICTMMDYSCDDIMAFRLKESCERAICKHIDILVE